MTAISLTPKIVLPLLIEGEHGSFCTTSLSLSRALFVSSCPGGGKEGKGHAGHMWETEGMISSQPDKHFQLYVVT